MTNERTVADACATPPRATPYTTCASSIDDTRVVVMAPTPSDIPMLSVDRSIDNDQAPDHSNAAKNSSEEPSTKIDGTVCSDDRPVARSAKCSPAESAFDFRVNADS